MRNTKNNDLDALDLIIHQAAVRAADEGSSTPAERACDEAVVASVRAQIAAMRRNLLPAARPPVKAPPVRPSLIHLGREALLARLEALTTALGPAVQYAHRDLEGLSDDDLRRLIDAIEPADLA